MLAMRPHDHMDAMSKSAVLDMEPSVSIAMIQFPIRG
jgi:hypothetical protein